MSAQAPAAVTRRAPATFEQFGSSKVGTPGDCMTLHQALQRMSKRADRAASSCGHFWASWKKSWSDYPGGGVLQGPTATTHPWCLEGPGGRPSRNWNALKNALLLSVRALWMSRAVSQMEEALKAQLNRRALCCFARFKGLPPSWGAVRDRRRLLAVARDVSFWACGSTNDAG